MYNVCLNALSPVSSQSQSRDFILAEEESIFCLHIHHYRRTSCYQWKKKDIQLWWLLSQLVTVDVCVCFSLSTERNLFREYVQTLGMLQIQMGSITFKLGICCFFQLLYLNIDKLKFDSYTIKATLWTGLRTHLEAPGNLQPFKANSIKHMDQGRAAHIHQCELCSCSPFKETMSMFNEWLSSWYKKQINEA